MRHSALGLIVSLLVAWTTGSEAAEPAAPMTAGETRAFIRELAQYVFDHHLKRDESSPQRGMVYEYFDVTRKGQFDDFCGKALDTMHDGAWLAAAMVNAHRATGDEFYKEFLTKWQLPFYLKMLNHSDDLFSNRHNHARADRQSTWSIAKEWLLQDGEKGFVPYFWDDGGSVSLEMRNTKNEQLSFPGFNHFVHLQASNPQYRLHGYSLGSSNHMAQDLGVMLELAWLLLKDSKDSADQKLAAEVALGAKHLHECRMRHHGYIPMCAAPAALANADADLMRRVPAQDDWKSAAPANHYVRALYSFKSGYGVALPGFADDQQYLYYSGIAKHTGQLPRALAFKIIYDAFTQPLLYRYYSDDAEVPPGINRFDLHPYFCTDGKLVDYRSDRKGPSGKPRPIGSRMGPQNMICCGWALQALAEYPGLWEERYRREFANDLRVFIVDPPLPRQAESLKPPPAAEVKLGDVTLNLISTRLALQVRGVCSGDRATIKFYGGSQAQGSFAELVVGRDQSIAVTNDKGESLFHSGRAKPMGTDFKFEVDIPYTVAKGQNAWANGIEHGRYSVQVGDQTRDLYLASHESHVEEWLTRELAGGLRTWQTIFRDRGYIPTGIEAGANWENFSDSGGYAHLISAASQWLLCLEGKRDWEVQCGGEQEKEKEKEKEKELERIKNWEPQMKAFEELDAKHAPPQGAVLFVGSSSIRLWKLADSFPQMKAVNRGFGGSQLADSVYYAERIVIKHKPRVVVVYAGDNDLAGGKKPETVAADLQAFVTKVRAALPETKIVYIGIKPHGLARWKLIDKVRDANRRMKGIAEESDNVVFVDVEPPMLTAEGKPLPELFVKDGLHMTPRGYEVWTALVMPHLKQE